MKKGEDSHLKRLLLDSYKIAIRPQLEEYQFIVGDLYSLSLDKDFNPDVFGSEPIKKVRAILEIKDKVKEAYQDAKHYEALGDSGQAVESFDQSLCACYQLKLAINALMKENVYLAAKAHLARKQAEKDAERKENRIRYGIAQFIALVAVVVSIIALFR